MDSVILYMFIVITILALGMLFVITKIAKKRSGLDPKYYLEQWQRVEKLANMGETGWHVAILHADKLLDQALKTRGFHGETMGERMKSASKNNSFRHNDAVWNAHKLRNRLAHETEVRLNQVVVRKTLNTFKSALKDVGAL